MALSLPKLNIPKLSVPKLKLSAPALNKKQLPAIVGGVIVLAAAGWFGWQYFMEEPLPPPPPSKPQAVKTVKPAVKPKAAPVDAGKAQDKLIQEVLLASGLKQQLDQLPQRMVAGVAQAGKQQKRASPATLKAIDAAMAQSFTAEGFQNQVSADLKKNFDEKRMQALAKAFSTPTAKAMIELEHAEQPPQELAKFAHSAAATKPAPQRAALVKRIDAATRASDLAVDVAFASMKALALGIGGEGTRKTAAIDKSIEKQRAATTRKIRDATLLNLAFSYKDASDADLEKYAALYESEDVKWFYGLVYAAVLNEVKAASTEAAQRIAAEASKPGAATKLAHSKSGADARSCLDLDSNSAIIKCAEAYR